MNFGAAVLTLNSGSSIHYPETLRLFGTDGTGVTGRHTPALTTDAFDTGTSVLYPNSEFTPSSKPTVMTSLGYTWNTHANRMGAYTFSNPRIVGVDNDTVQSTIGVSAVADQNGVFQLTAAADAVVDAQFRVAFDVNSAKYGTTSTAYSNVFTIKNKNTNLSALTYKVGEGTRLRCLTSSKARPPIT